MESFNQPPILRSTINQSTDWIDVAPTPTPLWVGLHLWKRSIFMTIASMTVERFSNLYTTVIAYRDDDDDDDDRDDDDDDDDDDRDDDDDDDDDRDDDDDDDDDHDDDDDDDDHDDDDNDDDEVLQCFVLFIVVVLRLCWTLIPCCCTRICIASPLCMFSTHIITRFWFLIIVIVLLSRCLLDWSYRLTFLPTSMLMWRMFWPVYCHENVLLFVDSFQFHKHDPGWLSVLTKPGLEFSTFTVGCIGILSGLFWTINFHYHTTVYICEWLVTLDNLT